MSDDAIGVIGGSGLYELEGLENIKEERLTTPFGEPSDAFITGEFGGRKMVFLPRHGRGHRILPSELNYRANIWGMKKLGVGRIISVSACGSMKEEIVPGHIVVIDQFIDLSKHRVTTFYGDGIVGHTMFADPICGDLADILYDAGCAAGATMHKGGAYVNMEGPQFSTRAESNVYRSWGVSVIGMTNAPEAKLAREAEICYSTLALSTDYDCWHESEEDVTIDAVIAVMNANVAMSKKVITEAVGRIPEKRTCACVNASQYAVITDPAVIPEETMKKLELIIGKYIKK